MYLYDRLEREGHTDIANMPLVYGARNLWKQLQREGLAVARAARCRG